MAFQPVNYAGIPPMGASNISQGMQIGMAPFEEQRKARNDALTGALNKMKMKYLPREFESQAQLREAQAQKAIQDAQKQQILADILKNMSGGGAPDANATPDNDFVKTLFNKLVLGVDETPGQKEERELRTAQKKKEMESQYLTAPARTEHEQVLARAPQFIRGLQQLIDAPSPNYIHIPLLGDLTHRPAASKQHKSIVSDLGEIFARLRGYPKGQAGQEKAIAQLERGGFETDFAYRKRLKKLFPEIARTVAESARALNKPVPEWANKILKSQQKSASQSLSSLSDEELRKIAFGEN